MSWRLDSATPADAEALGAIVSAWVAETVWLPKRRDRDGDVAWCAERIALGAVRLLRGPGGIAGFLAREGEEIETIQVGKRHRGEGHGRRLLDDAKALSPGRLAIWSFQANEGARRFFRREGFLEAELTDGARNEAHLPDLRLVWGRP